MMNLPAKLPAHETSPRIPKPKSPRPPPKTGDPLVSNSVAHEIPSEHEITLECLYRQQICLAARYEWLLAQQGKRLEQAEQHIADTIRRELSHFTCHLKSSKDICSQKEGSGVYTVKSREEFEVEELPVAHGQSEPESIAFARFSSESTSVAQNSDSLEQLPTAGFKVTKESSQRKLLALGTKEVTEKRMFFQEVLRASKRRRPSSDSGGGSPKAATSLLDSHVGRVQRLNRDVDAPESRKGILDPSSSWHRCFNLCSSIILSYDCVVVPYWIAWEPRSNVLHAAFAFTVVFWVADMVRSFFIGFYQGGEIQLAWNAIVKNYVRTWFLFDVSINIMALSSILMQSWMANRPVIQEMILLFRASAVLRVARHCTRFNFFSITMDAPSSSRGLLIRSLKLIFLIILLNHFLACIWFAIGRLTADPDTGLTWLDTIVKGNSGMDSHFSYWEASALFQYTTALHWSMTQMSPGSMEVFPRNSTERIYNILCLFIGLVVSAIVVSQLSAKLVQLQTANREKIKQVQDVRRFLHTYRIDRTLRRHIEAQVLERLKADKRLVEQDVPALSLLSTKLVKDLRIELFHSILLQHHLFLTWAHMDPSLTENICYEAVEFQMCSPGDYIFAAHSHADKMYFVLKGALTYTATHTSECESQKVTIHPGQWVSEAALWMEWTYLGTLEATTPCELLAVKVQDLLRLLNKRASVAKLNFHYCEAFCDLCDYGRLDVKVEQEQVIAHMPGTEREQMQTPLLDSLLSRYGSKQHAPQEFMRLEQELKEGRSVLTLVETGVQRVTFLCLMIVTRMEGTAEEMLIQLAESCSDSQRVKPALGLPGVKLTEGEDPHAACQRILTDKLGLIAKGVISVEQVEQVVEVASSRSILGLQTKYVKTIMRALYGRHDEQDACEHLSPVMRSAVTGKAPKKLYNMQSKGYASKLPSTFIKVQKWTSGLSSKFTRLAAGSRQLSKQLHQNFSSTSSNVSDVAPFLNTVEVHTCKHTGDKEFLYAWLTEKEYAELKGPDGEERLAIWCERRTLQMHPTKSTSREWRVPSKEEWRGPSKEDVPAHPG
eukprot:gnl/MRDRNA2_/MRDRNA2_38231_c0_seq1.p1 gnl/MRDRNA2_/MRDRNA2_38231_c0~~gnl/MRDRNA2_/MRDRNA2_38231_c0_seq1.p1  ORF type:complete len:1059 (-),score=136.93 gnl/MRDRNA2_/MRDRNA2_38231_c0_seq1:114-3290(-)